MSSVVGGVGPELEQLLRFLGEAAYWKIRRFPLRKYPASRQLLINELANVGRYWFGSNLFSITLNPSFYLHMSKDTRLLGLREAFFLNKRLPKDSWLQLVTEEWWHAALAKGLLRDEHNSHYRFLYRIVPYGSYLLVTSPYDRDAEGFTYLSYDSLFFADFLARRLRGLSFTGERALDVCSGVGMLSFAISKYNAEVLGTETNPNAVRLAGMNAEINQFSNCRFSASSLFVGIGGLFDLVISNPPFVHYSGPSKGPLDSDGGRPFGLGITIDIIKQVPDYLKEKGRAFLLTRSPVMDGRDFLLEELLHLLPNDFGWVYHHVSDAVAPLEADDIAAGIEYYRHVVVELTRVNGGQRRMATYPYWYRRTSLF